MKFTFEDYKIFCNDFKLNPSYYKTLKIFKQYCNGNNEIVFGLI